MSRNPNDNISDIKNDNRTTLDHNNDAYKSAQDNHANQKNPNHSEYWHSRGLEKPTGK